MSSESMSTSFFTGSDSIMMPVKSVDCEYKRERPKESIEYLKTVVAFANGNGES